MPKVSVYQIMKDAQDKSGSSKKYRSGAISEEDDNANILIDSSDDGKVYQNYYKYSDPKAAKKAFDDFMAEAEIAEEMDGQKKGGAVNLSRCKVSTSQKNKSSPKW